MRLVDEMRARGVDPVAVDVPEIVAAWARLGDEREIEKIIKSIEIGREAPQTVGSRERGALV